MRNSFVRRTMIFFISICIIPFLIFTLVFVNKAQSIEKERVEDSLNAIVTEKASALEKDLANIENQTVNLAQWAAHVMNLPYRAGDLSGEYIRNNIGVLERVTNNVSDKSNVFLPKTIELNEYLAGEIINTGKMEGAMSAIIKQNQDISYAYIITANGLLRVYPYLSNEAFAPDHDQRTDYFYTNAIGSENPEGRAVWTNPYYDYGGKGWVITCSSPFYVNGRLGGVVCLDVSLETLSKSIADFRMGNSGFAFVLSQDGDVIYHPEMMEIISKMGEKYQFNLLEQKVGSDVYRQILENMVKAKSGIGTYKDGREDIIIAYTPIKTLGWSLGIEVGKREYAMGADFLTIGFWLLLIALFVVCLAMALILSKRITRPIIALTEDVKGMADGKFGRVNVTSDDEIGLLGEAYNTMSQEISEYTSSLIHKKNQLETVINSIGGVMMILKPDLTLSMINQKGLDLLKEADINKVVGKKCSDLFKGTSELCNKCLLKTTLENGKISSQEIVHNQNIYKISSYPVFDEEGKLEEVVVYSRIITEQVMLEKELLQSEKMAGIGQMAAGITHELKNPLAIIKGAVYLLKNAADNALKKQEALDEINDSVYRAEKIIYNMLDFSKTSLKEKELIQVRVLLEQILLLVRQDLVKRKINTAIAFEEEPLYIYGNADSFKHIFLNIVTNAIDAMPHGGDLTIRAKRIDEDKSDEEKIEIMLSNTGEPIPDENLKKIFQPFFTTKETGTGLGLWIASKEAARNGGTIEVFSNGLTQLRVVLLGRENRSEQNPDD